ncbi:MAG TPA: amino acid permease [Gemmatimonadaceae bacterium]|nr:amino acid permease [Gemmatimonadaceae bacterium]
MSGPSAAGGGLRRELGVFSASMMVVGGIIGSGIFFTPAVSARALPSAGWVLAVWAAGGVVALAGALTYAELGTMLPDAGGPYVYLREAFGPFIAFLYGWMALVLIASGAIAAVALGFAGYLERFVDLAPAGGRMGTAALTILLLSLVNYLGVKPGAVVQNVLTVAKVLALAALIVGGLVLWGRVAPPAAVPGAPAPRTPLIAALGAAFVPVLFTIGGWQQMNMAAGEVRDPARTIPRALVTGVALVIAIYLGANVVYLHALGRDGLALSNAAAADAATRIFGPAGGTFIALSAMISIFGFTSVAILSNSRIVYAMAADGVFLRAAGRVHPRFGSPHVAILLLAAWSLVLLFGARGDLGTLLDGVVFADWIFFGLGAASVFVLRRTRPDAERPYRVRGYPWLPAFFVAAAVGGVASAVLAAPTVSLIGAGLLAAGAGAYALGARARRSR